MEAAEEAKNQWSPFPLRLSSFVPVPPPLNTSNVNIRITLKKHQWSLLTTVPSENKVDSDCKITHDGNLSVTYGNKLFFLRHRLPNFSKPPDCVFMEGNDWRARQAQISQSVIRHEAPLGAIHTQSHTN